MVGATQGHPWWLLALGEQLSLGKGQSVAAPPRGFLLGGISLLQTPQLWRIHASPAQDNATLSYMVGLASRWEMPPPPYPASTWVVWGRPHAWGVLPVTDSSYFRKGDKNKWKDKVPLV